MTAQFSFQHMLAIGALALGGAILPANPVYAGSLSVEQLLDVRSGAAGTIQHAITSKDVRDALKDAPALQTFYLKRDFKPYWVNASKPQSNAYDLIKALEGSWQHGLNPKHYRLKDIRVLFEDGDDARLADLDVLLSDAYIRLAQDLTGIRVDPRFMKSHARYWKQPLAAAELLELLERTSDIEALLGSLGPQGQTYKRLQEELVKLLQSDPEPYEDILPLQTQNMLLPLTRDPVVPDLRLRLGLEVAQTEDPYLYDDQLAAAVIRFQRENSLKDDGIIGAQTLGILNRSRMQKIEQIIANLERLRWVEEEKPDTFVVVNIPSAMLWAVEDGRVAFEMPVVVGRGERPTNVFRTDITGVRFNPDWTVPKTIKREDIVPKLQEDPQYLTNKGMQLISGTGEEAMTLDPAAFDWQSISEDELNSLRMVQVPGTQNPLGRFRIHMPNTYNIYLHDTNEPQYFDRADRAVSSGCVRMKHPERMAHFILKQRQGWNQEAMESLLQKEETSDLYIQKPIPVYLLYYTIWLNAAGNLVYGNDIYDFDNDLMKILRNIDGFFIPVDNT